jgi:hypothetical protein
MGRPVPADDLPGNIVPASDLPDSAPAQQVGQGITAKPDDSASLGEVGSALKLMGGAALYTVG